MSIIEKDTQINIKTNKQMLSEAKKVFTSKKIDTTAGINMYLQYVATQKKLPFLTDEEGEREQLIAGLQERVERNYQELLAGEYVTLEEMERELID